MFVYQPTFNKLHIKKDKGTDYILSWRSKGLYSSVLSPQHTAFLHSIKISENKMGIRFDKDPLVVEQSSYAIKIVNAYILYELDTWPKTPLRNLHQKIACLERQK